MVLMLVMLIFRCFQLFLVPFDPERLVFTFAWEDENNRPKHETLVTVTFEEQDNKTLMTFQQAIFESTESRNAHNTGWSECFDRLATYLTEL
ncbi:hypothetical protein B7486_66650 [cyanobacterium TDX16]|nr:hypothetical protein B7486_66650 [cyanobacterium TDX16]